MDCKNCGEFRRLTEVLDTATLEKYYLCHECLPLMEVTGNVVAAGTEAEETFWDEMKAQGLA